MKSLSQPIPAYDCFMLPKQMSLLSSGELAGALVAAAEKLGALQDANLADLAAAEHRATAAVLAVLKCEAADSEQGRDATSGELAQALGAIQVRESEAQQAFKSAASLRQATALYCLFCLKAATFRK